MSTARRSRSTRILLTLALALGITVAAGLAFGGRTASEQPAELTLSSFAETEPTPSPDAASGPATALPTAPLRAEPAQPVAPASAAALAAGASQAREAWRVEAEAIQRRLMSSLLSGDEAQIQTARQAAEAFAASQGQR